MWNPTAILNSKHFLHKCCSYTDELKVPRIQTHNFAIFRLLSLSFRSAYIKGRVDPKYQLISNESFPQ